MIVQYRDHNGPFYLELHALRAPVGGYLQELVDNPDRYDSAVLTALHAFERDNDVTIYTLGRSGRHICIEDTPRNRRRYTLLRRKAIAAAQAMWATMRATK